MTREQNVRTRTRLGVKARPDLDKGRLAVAKAGPSLSKARLVEHVAKEAELSKASAAAALDAMLDGIGKSVKRGDEVRLVGFGTFSVRERVAGEGRSPDPTTKADVSASAFEPGPRARALLRGIEIAQEDLRNTGGAYSLDEVQTLMRGVSRQRIERRVREGSLLAVPGPSNRRRYPTVQFNPDGTIVEGLKQVCEALPTKNPWSVLNFLVAPEDRLDGRKPIDLLRAGKVEIVIQAARRMGQQGA